MKTIIEIQQMLAHEYGDKFLVTEAKSKIWKQILSDFDRETILAAVYHLVSISGPFPPVIGEIRRQCVDIKLGELSVLPAPEAWLRIQFKIQGKDVQLNEDETTALKQTGSLYDLRHTTNAHADRAYFVKAYNAVIEKRNTQRYTMPNVANLANNNAPALPAPEPKLPELLPITVATTDDGRPVVDSDEVQAMIQQTIGDMSIEPEWAKDKRGDR